MANRVLTCLFGPNAQGVSNEKLRLWLGAVHRPFLERSLMKPSVTIQAGGSMRVDLMIKGRPEDAPNTVAAVGGAIADRLSERK